MKEGKIGDWLVKPDQPIREGDDLLEIETDKITNVMEAPSSGVLRRQLVQPGETVRVGGIIGVVASAEVSDAEIDAFIADFAQNSDDDDHDDVQEQAAPMQIAMLGDRPVQYSRTGPSDGEAVVLIHGFAGDANGWMMTSVELAKAHDVIIPDMPGHGGSTKAVGDGSIAGLATDLAGLLDNLGIAAAHLVGHSLGSAVALEFARANSARVKSLTLIAPIGLPGTTVSQEFLRGVVTAVRQRDMRHWLEMLVANPRLISKAMVDDVIKAKRGDGAADALRTLADRLCAGDDLQALEHDVPQGSPTLVIVGEHDQIAGQPDAGRLPSNFGVERITSVGHMPHVEAFGAVNALIVKHISQAS